MRVDITLDLVAIDTYCQQVCLMVSSVDRATGVVQQYVQRSVGIDSQDQVASFCINVKGIIVVISSRGYKTKDDPSQVSLDQCHLHLISEIFEQRFGSSAILSRAVTRRNCIIGAIIKPACKGTWIGDDLRIPFIASSVV